MKVKEEIISIIVHEKRDFYSQVGVQKISSELGKYIYEQEIGIPIKKKKFYSY